MSAYSKLKGLFRVLFLTLIISCEPKQSTDLLDKKALNELEHSYAQNLTHAIDYLDTILVSENSKHKYFYHKSRDSFKKAELVLAFTDPDNYSALNQANFLKVEEEDATNIKYLKPFGYQVLEEMIYADAFDQKELFKIITYTKQRLKLIKANLHIQIKDYHLLWMIREQIFRIALTSITGFDSPASGKSLEESIFCYDYISQVLDIYAFKFSDKQLLQEWKNEINETKTTLSQTDFEAFDRYDFLKNRVRRQINLWNKTVSDWQVNFPFERAIANNAQSLFSKSTFNTSHFIDFDKQLSHNAEKSRLGKKLFHDKRLSLSQKMSCATCHDENLAFTDGLTKFPKQKRNTPTLLYSSLQKSFFYDGRAKGLEGQILGVVENENEFHSSSEQIAKTVKSIAAYRSDFDSLYAGKINSLNIRNAIASYIRDLNKFTSKFDKNMRNEEQSMNENEINGFNLFMGKAQCGTCHFAPVFNGTLPPTFMHSELESLGVPDNASNDSPVSNDLGRYDIFQTPERKHFFKTPTLRNINKTAPYMHNGVFETLEEVMDFYNAGGGNGRGFNLAHQTLPSDSLHLSPSEIQDIISFMLTLDDINI
ncbi:cytochrome-c peroxidase [Aureibacter tunicatorum]|uniref:Cytochrome c peroxidase n=1 Tax=Aureibacter tunicatorum TaxID=866807 RepID=A0AAE3XP38_9BACT|nr:cytochrome c peroxidase [Aureibacter tunicatorum]MDR6240050.1 cytochrome c peroxidase [Aureibacter tunicatorum]BDD04522.1 cytochrome-c peroxidase [Aureibacter tunicatorum]